MQKVISLIQRSAPYWLHYFLSLVIAVLVFFVGTKIIKKFLKIMRSSMEKREMETGVISFFLSACKIALYLLFIVIVSLLFLPASQVFFEIFFRLFSLYPADNFSFIHDSPNGRTPERLFLGVFAALSVSAISCTSIPLKITPANGPGISFSCVS